jgi:glutamine amidotransferase
MCRFLAYIGTPILMDELLYQPHNSLINQSIKAHESDEPLNGDGFGVGWYMPEIDSEPGRFVSVMPAWSNRNLRSISSKIISPCVFAHVRAASLGAVSETNCHPFQFKNYLFMHNGDIEDFLLIKRDLRNMLEDDLYNNIQGQTDSEHIFALFLHILFSKKKIIDVVLMAECLEEMIDCINELKKKHNAKRTDYINACITDGNEIVAIRYVSAGNEKAPTLYYSEGAAFECKDGVCRMKKHETEESVLIVSEKLTAYRSDWNEIPENHILMVSKALKTSLKIAEIEIPKKENI